MTEDVSTESGPRFRRFDISEYGRMLEGTFFDENSRVDLVSGYLAQAEAYGPRRIDTMDRIGKLLRRQDDIDLLALVKRRVRFDWYTEMWPDVALVRNYPKVLRLYSVAPPAPRDILHIVEVTDDPASDLHAWKSRVYAHFGIGRLWVVDLHRQRIVDHAVAEPDGYGSVRTYERGESIRGLLSIDPPVSVDEILGSPER